MDDIAHLINTELKLIALLSRPIQTTQQIKQSAELIQLIDIVYFKALLDRHRIWSCVYFNIKVHFLTLFPVTLIHYLHKKHQQNIKQSQQQFKAYAELCRLFKKSNIPAKPLKGILLAQKLYGDITKRHSKDIDFIIPIKYLSLADEKLNALDYHCPDYQQLTDAQRKLYCKAHKDLIYINNAGMEVELHFRLSTHSTLLSKIYTQQLFKNNPCKEAQCHYELIYLCWHTTQSLHHRLKWLVDIALYIEYIQMYHNQSIDQLIGLAKELDSMRVLTISWVLANTLYDTALTADIKNFYDQDRISKRLTKQSLKALNHPNYPRSIRFKFEMYFCNILLPQCWSDKKYPLLQKMYPDIIDIKLFSMIPAKLFFLLYLLRPFTLLYRCIRV